MGSSDGRAGRNASGRGRSPGAATGAPAGPRRSRWPGQGGGPVEGARWDWRGGAEWPHRSSREAGAARIPQLLRRMLFRVEGGPGGVESDGGRKGTESEARVGELRRRWSAAAPLLPPRERKGWAGSSRRVSHPAWWGRLVVGVAPAGRPRGRTPSCPAATGSRPRCCSSPPAARFWSPRVTRRARTCSRVFTPRPSSGRGAGLAPGMQRGCPASSLTSGFQAGSVPRVTGMAQTQEAAGARPRRASPHTS